MNQTELQARALATAKRRNIHVFAMPGRPGVYTCTSLSEPGVKHVLVARDGTEACDCKGYSYRKSCCHVEALRCRLARESVQAHRRQPAASVSDLYA